jgi:mannitol/fructose-specific phosphotransferase system IIA component (Ntr-type)/F0F1-type ATP synthase epsilon subunit
MAKVFAAEIWESSELVFRHSIASLTLPTEDKGSVTVMAGYPPTALRLAPGVVRAKSFDGLSRYFAIHGGEAAITRNGVKVVTPEVALPGRVDVEDAETQYDYATSILASPDTPAHKLVEVKEIQQWACARLDVARKDERGIDQIARLSEGCEPHPLRLSDHLAVDRVKMSMEAEDRWQAIDELVGCLAESLDLSERGRKNVREQIVSREEMMSTAIGGRVAIPHCANYNVDGVAMALGISREGIDFQALDNQLVNVVILTAIRRSEFNVYVRTLGSIARLFNRTDVLDEVLACDTPKQLLSTLHGAEDDILIG